MPSQCYSTVSMAWSSLLFSSLSASQERRNRLCKTPFWTFFGREHNSILPNGAHWLGFCVMPITALSAKGDASITRIPLERELSSRLETKYTYDPVGNRLSNLSGSGWSYNTSNELDSRPGGTYTYDANGNTTTKIDSSGTTAYSWDYENRLSSVTRAACCCAEEKAVVNDNWRIKEPLPKSIAHFGIRPKGKNKMRKAVIGLLALLVVGAVSAHPHHQAVVSMNQGTASTLDSWRHFFLQTAVRANGQPDAQVLQQTVQVVMISTAFRTQFLAAIATYNAGQEASPDVTGAAMQAFFQQRDSLTQQFVNQMSTALPPQQFASLGKFIEERRLKIKSTNAPRGTANASLSPIPPAQNNTGTYSCGGSEFSCSGTYSVSVGINGPLVFQDNKNLPNFLDNGAPVAIISIFEGGVTMSLPGGIPGGTYHTSNVQLIVNGTPQTFNGSHVCPTCYLEQEAQFANLAPVLGVPVTLSDSGWFLCSIAGVFLQTGTNTQNVEKAQTYMVNNATSCTAAQGCTIMSNSPWYIPDATGLPNEGTPTTSPQLYTLNVGFWPMKNYCTVSGLPDANFNYFTMAMPLLYYQGTNLNGTVIYPTTGAFANANIWLWRLSSTAYWNTVPSWFTLDNYLESFGPLYEPNMPWNLPTASVIFLSAQGSWLNKQPCTQTAGGAYSVEVLPYPPYRSKPPF